MRINDLIIKWNKRKAKQYSQQEYVIRLPLEDAARVAALSELYSVQSENEIISDLISAALEELETRMPYVKGNKVVGEDEMGDPVYADEGLTPRYLELSKKFLKRLGAAN